MEKKLKLFLRQLSNELIYPYDSDEVKYQKIGIFLVSVFTIFITLSSSIISLFDEKYELTLVFFLQTLAIGINLIYFIITRRFGHFLFNSLISTLFFPQIIYWILNDLVGLTILFCWGIALTIYCFRFIDLKYTMAFPAIYFALCVLNIYFGKLSTDSQFLSVSSGGLIAILHLTIDVTLSLFIITFLMKKSLLLQNELFNQKFIVEKEKAKAEKMLGDLLPEVIAERIKNNQEGRMITDYFDDITVLFADIVGFTSLSERVTSIELVDMLNVIFSKFDELAEKYGLEKIKTMGDAYMAASGVPLATSDHAEKAAAMALEMVVELDKFAQMIGEDIQIRVGLNSGPAVAGVIGLKKGVYDIWGDTVNVAARMESHGLANKVQVSETTFQHLDKSGEFKIKQRGAINVKGKGIMKTYIVTGRHISREQSIFAQVAPVVADVKQFV